MTKSRDFIEQILIATLVYIIAFVYSILVAPTLVNNKTIIGSKLNELHETCVIGCDTLELCELETKGSSYYIGSDKKSNNCIISFWSVTHFIMYSILGYFCVDLFWYMFLISLIFEVYECYMYQCEDFLFDPICNLSGLALGSYLNEINAFDF